MSEAREIAGDLFTMLAPLWVDLADLIGHKCSCHGCSEIAIMLVPWPGRDALPQCKGHYEHTMLVADVFEMRETIRLGCRPLQVIDRRPEPDPSALRFAAIELT